MANSQHERRFRQVVQTNEAMADLSGYGLSGISFPSLRLVGAILRGADLRGANLSGGYFRGCDLRDANCSETRIPLGDFRDADLSGADLSGADWTGAVLTGANLAQANLNRSTLVKARLDGADLTGADLKGADLRGVRGLTVEQLATARNSSTAILSEKMLTNLGRTGDHTSARHGAPGRKSPEHQVDFLFTTLKPTFGDVFLLCGDEHPDFPPTNDFGFGELADLGIRQMDDYFALCVHGEPAVWIFPLVRGRVVHHHPGPYDGLRVVADDPQYIEVWSRCVARFEKDLRVPVSR